MKENILLDGNYWVGWGISTVSIVLVVGLVFGIDFKLLGFIPVAFVTIVLIDYFKHGVGIP